MRTNQKPGFFEAIDYDVLLDIRTRIGGRYQAWATQAEGTPDADHWIKEYMKVREFVDSVDQDDPAAVSDATDRLVSLWKALPSERPRLVA